MATIIKEKDFEETVIKSELPVLVDFFAEWCGPCKMIAPMIDELSTEMSGKSKIVKIDIDEAKDVVSRYGIRSVPTLLFFKGGKVVDQVVGAVPKNIMVQKIENMF